MYQIVEKGNEYDLFSNQVISYLYAVVAKEITNMLRVKANPKLNILGAFAIHDVPIKKGGKKNVWIEYNAKLFPSLSTVDAGIHNCIIYDSNEIPDIVLDKYNEIKTLIFNGEKPTS